MHNSGLRALWLIVPALAAVGWSKDPDGFTHPVQKLLIAYRSSVPLESQIREAGKSKGAIEATYAILETDATRQSWPAAIVALGILGTPENKDLIEKLIAFQENGLAFGCSRGSEPQCSGRREDLSARQSLDLARLSVPISLGYLLKQTPDQPTGNIRGGRNVTVSDPILEELSNLADESYVEKHIAWSCQPKHAGTDTRRLQLQINAIHALALSQKAEANSRLLHISTTSSDPLVRQEARYALESSRIVP